MKIDKDTEASRHELRRQIRLLNDELQIARDYEIPALKSQLITLWSKLIKIQSPLIIPA